MILDHNTYSEAISGIRLSDETGRNLLEDAIERKERRMKQWKVKAAAAVAGIFIFVLGANGICFAKTGMNVWDLFQSLYHESDNKETQAIAETFRESGESFVDEMLQVKFTLEYYWYDNENGGLYFSMRADSLDGSPMTEKKDRWDVMADAMTFQNGGSGSSKSSEPVYNDDQSSMWKYYAVSFMSPDKEAEFYDKATIEVYGADGDPADESTQWTKSNTFEVEATGQMKYLTLDESRIDCCTRAEVSGAQIFFFFDKNINLEDEDEESPFTYVELKMADGTSYYVMNFGANDIEAITDENTGETTAFKVGETKIPQERVLSNFACGGGGNGETESGYLYGYHATFDSFLDIDELKSVWVDGEEVPFK